MPQQKDKASISKHKTSPNIHTPSEIIEQKQNQEVKPKRMLTFENLTKNIRTFFPPLYSALGVPNLPFPARRFFISTPLRIRIIPI